MPDAVRAFAAGQPLEAVWRNELGGLTWRVGAAAARAFVKWAPVGTGLDLGAERMRLTWLAGRTRAPQVVAHGGDADGDWLATTPLPGQSAVAQPWADRPETAVVAIARGLRQLHDELDPTDCPFSWSASFRLKRVRAALTGPEIAGLSDIPPVDRLVVCHGDPCAPNTLLDEKGDFAGHVDLGALGVADRWADLAVASWSLEWNYGPDWQVLFFAAYGVAPDPRRIAYYRRLWAAG